MKTFLSLLAAAAAVPALAETAPYFRYENKIGTSPFAKDAFGKERSYDRGKPVEFGSVGASVSSRLDCGRLDLKADIHAQLKQLKAQVESLIPNPKDMSGYLGQAAMLTTCYAYPTICAQLRHDFLSIQGQLNLRSQACAAVDKFIDNQAEKGAKQLRAEAEADCVSRSISEGGDVAAALTECQRLKSGLPLRDFQAGLEKKFTTGKQKVLSAIVGFSEDTKSYPILSSFLGEIEVQEDGYWQPLFPNKLVKPADLANTFFAEGQDATCKNLEAGLAGNVSAPAPYADHIREVLRRKLTKEDAENLAQLGPADKRLACLALGRAVGREAALRASAKLESVMASGLLNTSIPNGLRDEYRSRAAAAFPALRAAVESEDIPPVETIRKAISDLAFVNREKTRLLAAHMSRGRLANDVEASREASECTDTLSCSR